MDKELIYSIATILTIAAGRIMSNYEHRQTTKMLNGQLEERIKKAVEDGIAKELENRK